MTKLTPSNAGTFETTLSNDTAAATIGAAIKPRTMPEKIGLYDPRNEHDACGVGFIAHMKNQKSHSIVEKGLQILENLTHRGAVGADPLMGDGAGMLVQIPDRLYREEMAGQGIELPAAGQYGVGHVFMPQDAEKRRHIEAVFEEVVREEGQTILGWRDVPVNTDYIGQVATECMPTIRQFFVAKGDAVADERAFDRKLYVIRKIIEHAVEDA